MNREVSISHIIVTISLVVAGFQWANDQDKRVARLEVLQAQQAAAQAETDRAQDAARNAALSQVIARLDRIEDKLDRSLEGGSGGEATRHKKSLARGDPSAM